MQGFLRVYECNSVIDGLDVVMPKSNIRAKYRYTYKESSSCSEKALTRGPAWIYVLRALKTKFIAIRMVNDTLDILVLIGDGASKQSIPLLSLPVDSLDEPPPHILLLIGP